MTADNLCRLPECSAGTSSDVEDIDKEKNIIFRIDIDVTRVKRGVVYQPLRSWQNLSCAHWLSSFQNSHFWSSQTDCHWCRLHFQTDNLLESINIEEAYSIFIDAHQIFVIYSPLSTHFSKDHILSLLDHLRMHRAFHWMPLMAVPALPYPTPFSQSIGQFSGRMTQQSLSIHIHRIHQRRRSVHRQWLQKRGRVCDSSIL